MNTSANVDGDFYDSIVQLSKITSVSVSDIYKEILKMMIKSSKLRYVAGRLSEYQNHSPERWEKLHYSLNEEEIELISNARQNFKISISNLAFAGYLLFWNVIVEKLLKKSKKSNIENILRTYDEYKEKLANYCSYYKKRLKVIKKE